MISGREKGKKRHIPFTKRRNIYCRAVPEWVPVLYTRRTHGEESVTAAAVEREEKESVVLPFVPFPPDNIYFIAPDIQY